MPSKERMLGHLHRAMDESISSLTGIVDALERAHVAAHAACSMCSRDSSPVLHVKTGRSVSHGINSKAAGTLRLNKHILLVGMLVNGHEPHFLLLPFAVPSTALHCLQASLIILLFHK